jgi:hypothetical protein
MSSWPNYGAWSQGPQGRKILPQYCDIETLPALPDCLLGNFMLQLQPGMAVHICNPSYSRGRGRRITSSRLAWAKLMRSYLKIKTQTKWLGVWLKWYSACLPQEIPWVRSPVPQKRKILLFQTSKLSVCPTEFKLATLTIL